MNYPFKELREEFEAIVTTAKQTRDRVDSVQAAAAVSPARREGRDGRDGLGPSCPEGDDSRMNMDAC